MNVTKISTARLQRLLDCRMLDVVSAIEMALHDDNLGNVGHSA
jgi:hypothetical protein